MTAEFWENVMAGVTASVFCGSAVYLWQQLNQLRIPKITKQNTLAERVEEGRQALNGRSLSEYRRQVALGAFGLTVVTIGLFFYLQLMARISSYFGLSWAIFYDLSSYVVGIFGSALAFSLIFRIGRIYEIHAEFRAHKARAGKKIAG